MENLRQQFRGTISAVEATAGYRGHHSEWCPHADDVDLVSMARAALNYLRGNPDPARGYECKFSLGPLGIPCLVPLIPSNTYAYDPVTQGDTDCRMDWQVCMSARKT